MAGSGLGGLPVPGYWALMVLAEGGTEAGRLQRELGVSKQAVSKLVDTLVVAGLVDRHTNRSDRRKTDLVLTARGRTAAGLIEDAVVDTQASFVAEVGAEAFTRLVETLERLGGREG
jgi:DNA-binding MarR family transcriptional regulator